MCVCVVKLNEEQELADLHEEMKIFLFRRLEASLLQECGETSTAGLQAQGVANSSTTSKVVARPGQWTCGTLGDSDIWWKGYSMMSSLTVILMCFPHAPTC